MNKTITRRHALAAGAGLLACAALPTRAQSPWPNKAISYVVPFSAGGLTDVMARLIGQKLSGVLGQPVVVDNKPGGNANIGANLVAKAPADGYTWLAVTMTHVVNPALFPDLPYQLARDLTPVVHLATSPLALVVPANSPIQNLDDFLRAARARTLNGGSSGNGTPPHLGQELLAAGGKLSFTHVPYKGGAPSLNDLMGGQIDFIVSNLPECMSFVQAGRLRALAMTSKARQPLLPDVPTFTELGMADVELENWTGMMMPAGVPRAIIERVGADAARLVREPDVIERLTPMGFSATGLGPAQFAAIVQADLARWRKIVAERNIRPGG